MTALKLTLEERIALYERLSRVACERAQAPGTHPALAAFYLDIAVNYSNAVKELVEEYKDRQRAPQGSAP